MGATSVTGSGGGDTGRRVGYVHVENIELNRRPQQYNVGIGNSNPRVVAAGQLTLNDDGFGSVYLPPWGEIEWSCEMDGSECHWQLAVQLAVAKSYTNGGDFEYLSHVFVADDPVFSHAEIVNGTAPFPRLAVDFAGEPGQDIDYIISTWGKVQ